MTATFSDSFWEGVAVGELRLPFDGREVEVFDKWSLLQWRGCTQLKGTIMAIGP
jgi:hypothetical protein